MDAIEAILSRRSIRKYKKQPVEWEKVGIILEAGRMAPCAGNLQDWRFIVVLDAEKRKQIAEASLQQYWMADAPVHIVIVAELEKSKRFYGVRGERLYSVQNCAAAAESMIIAANSIGLGTCWVGAFDEDKIKTILNCIEEVRPQIIITLGYADEKPIMPQKLPIENIVYLEKWWGRIKDADEYFGRTSVKVMRTLDRGKAILEKIDKKLRKTP